jgi:hypothetical protein
MNPDEHSGGDVVKAVIVKPRSHLVGKRCQVGCRNQIGIGQAVLVHRLDPLNVAAGADPWFVMHVTCVQAKCDAAPTGLPPTNTEANIALWRRQLLADGAKPVRSS